MATNALPAVQRTELYVYRVQWGRLKSREWTTWHEETGVDNAGVSDREK